MLEEELFELADAFHTEAVGAGWNELDTDTAAIQAALAMGKSRGVNVAATLVEQSEEASQSTLDGLGVNTLSDFIGHPSRTVSQFQVDSKNRDMFEASPLVESIDVLDDQTITVTMVTNMPEEI